MGQGGRTSPTLSALRRRLADAGVAGGCDRLGAIRHLQLGEDVRYVVSHGSFAEVRSVSIKPSGGR